MKINMKIKHRLTVTAFAVAVGILCAGALRSAAVLDKNNPEDVARALLSFGPTKTYMGQWLGIKTNGMWTWGTFIMDASMSITNMSIESGNIPIPVGEPLKGLPVALGLPLREFSVWVTAIDDDDREKSKGSFYAETLSPDSVINIILVPGRVSRFVSYVPPDGTPADTVSLRMDDGEVYWYDAALGGFDLLMDPFGGDEWYKIVDGRTGRALFVGIVSPTMPPRVTDAKVLNISNIGNVTEAYLDYDRETGGYGISRWFWNQTLDSSVETGGVSYPAKVYVTDLEHVQELHGIMIYITDPTARISVKHWSEDGPLSEVGLLTMEATSAYRIVYSNEMGLEKLIITVTSSRTNEAFGIGINAICE
jgi:hypothetical protein